MSKCAGREALFASIASKIPYPNGKECFVFGINGVDTSGKTQFTLAFERYLKEKGHDVQVIHLDDFHHHRAVRMSDGDCIQGYFDHAFNLELLVDELLKPARLCHAVDKELTLLDLASDSSANRKRYRIGPGTVVLLEGVLLFRPPVDRFLDCMVYLHIGFDEVLRRAEARDVPLYGPEFLDRYRTKYIPIQQKYLAEYQPMERSDFVIDNTDYHNPKVMTIP